MHWKTERSFHEHRVGRFLGIWFSLLYPEEELLRVLGAAASPIRGDPLQDARQVVEVAAVTWSGCVVDGAQAA